MDGGIGLWNFIFFPPLFHNNYTEVSKLQYLNLAERGEGDFRWQLLVWQQDVNADACLCHGLLVYEHGQGALSGARGLLWRSG